MVSAAAWPLVGRGADVASIARQLARGRGVLLSGEAGIGKTSVAHAVLDQMRETGWETAVFEAGPAGGAVPFAPFASLTRPAPAGELDRLVDAAAALVARGSRVAALVDDAHALDSVSLAFMSHLLAATDVRLLVTVRPDGPGARLVRAWAHSLPLVSIRPLEREMVDSIVRDVLGDVAPAVLRWVWDTTRGNPLFVHELVTDSVERGALVERRGRWTLAVGSVPPSPRLQDVVADRVGALSSAERDAIELLALGAPLGVAVLESLVGDDPVQQLERRGLLRADRSDRRVSVRLAHPIHGEVVRQLLGPSTAAAQRRRLLEAVSSHGERRRSDRVQTALWRVELGDLRDPADLLAALDDLHLLADHVELVAGGLELLDRSVQLTRAAFDGGGGVDAAVLLLWALSRGGRHDDARAVLANLGALDGDEAARVLVSQRLADIEALIRGDPRAALQRLNELEALTTSAALMRSIRASRADALAAGGEMADALALATAVLDDVDVTIEDRARASAAAAVALGAAGRTDEAREILDAIRPLAADENLQVQAGLVVPELYVLGAAGRFDAVERLATWLYDFSREHGVDDGVAIFGSVLASAALQRGRPRSTVSLVDVALEHLGQTNPVGVHRLLLAVRATASSLLADPRAAREAIGQLEGLAGTSAFRSHEMTARAWTDVALGQTDRAIRLLVEEAAHADGRGDVLGAVIHLHDVARLGRADLVAERVTALAARTTSRLIAARAAHVAALAADDALALERASTSLGDLGVLLEAAEASTVAAALHRRAGRRGKASTAATRGRALIAACEGARTPALRGAEPLLSLSRREREVAGLAAAGMSDRDIAQQLVVSIRTVHTHLNHVYGKLAIGGRSDLAAAMALNGEHGNASG